MLEHLSGVLHVKYFAKFSLWEWLTSSSSSSMLFDLFIGRRDFSSKDLMRINVHAGIWEQDR